MYDRDAMEMVKSVFPGRSICIKSELWCYDSCGSKRGDDVGYTISVLPGWDGQKCSQMSGPDLALLCMKVAAQSGKVQVLGPDERQRVPDPNDADMVISGGA
jgi:hypothetical protein